jgi:hypothetical protein
MQGRSTDGQAAYASATARLLLMALALYVVFVAVVGWSFWQRELWSDEAVSLMLIGGHDPAAVAPGSYTAAQLAAFHDPASGPSLGEIWRRAAERDNHPPGYSVLFAAIVGLTGDIGPQGVRFVNIALTGLFVFPMLLLMRELGWRPAWATAALATLSPFAIYAAREIRAYGLMLLLATVSAWLTMRALRAGRRRWAWLLALLAVDVAGMALHKLFVCVVTAQLCLLGWHALRRREAGEIAGVVLLALASGVAALLLPNVLTVNPTIGAFETAWLQQPRNPLFVVNSALIYLGYYAAWWIAPPDDMTYTLYGIAFFVAFGALLLWLAWLLGRELRRERWPGPALLFLVPPGIMLALYVATGNDFSQAARYSVIWSPVAAAWLLSRLRDGRELAWFTGYAAVSLAVSCTLVLTSTSHRNPDNTPAFVRLLEPMASPRLVWAMDTTLNTRALLLALQPEMTRMGIAPAEFVVANAADVAATARSGNIIAGPERYRRWLMRACVPRSLRTIGAYFACTAT